MELTIKLNDTETKAYAMTISDFLRTIGGAPLAQQVAQAAPVVTTPPPQSIAGEPDEQPATNPPAVDSAGLPWDERIHSPNKTTIANGNWRKKKGVSDEIVAQVESELRNQQQPQPAAAPVITTPPPQPMTTDALFAAPVQPTAEQMFAQFAAQQQPAVQLQPAAAPVITTPPPQPMNAGAPTDFPSFMKILAASVNTGKVDPAYIQSLCQRVGINAIAELAANPAKIGEAYNMMVVEGRV